MKKNISINIGGIIFHIEEDGYDRLKNYLDSITQYFSLFDDDKEIIEDIEGRIAEIFLARLENGNHVISSEDVEEVIATMGTTKDFDATIENEPEIEETTKEEAEKGTKNTSKEESYKRSKRLYRNNKGRMIGGVASGIANYFGTDPIWIRLLMVIFLFNVFHWEISSFTFVAYIVLWIAMPGNKELEEDKKVKKLFRGTGDRVLGGVSSGIAAYFGVDIVLVRILFFTVSIFFGAGVFIYIVLWIITPEARTITEKMQMQGESVTLSNIEENVKKNLHLEEGEEPVLVKILLFPFRLIAMVFKNLGEILGPLLRFVGEALRIGVGVFLVFLGFLLMVAFTVSLVVLLGVGEAMETWIYFEGFRLEQTFGSLNAFFIVSSYVTLIVPSLAMVLLGLMVLLRRKVISAFVAWSLFGLWLLGGIGLAVSLPAIVRNYVARDTFREDRTYLVKRFTPTLRLNHLGLDVYDNVDLRIRGHEDTVNYKLLLAFNARGYSRTDARKNAEAVDYVVMKENHDFLFDSGITFSDALFRFQKVEATFYIPYGKIFQMDDDLGKIIKSSLWEYGYSDSDMENNKWMFEETGELNCLTCGWYERRDTYEDHRYRKGNSNEQEVYQPWYFDKVELVHCWVLGSLIEPMTL